MNFTVACAQAGREAESRLTFPPPGLQTWFPASEISLAPLQFWVLEVYWGAPNAAQDPPLTAPLLSASRTTHLPGQLNTAGLSVPRASVEPSDFTRCLQKPGYPSGSWALGAWSSLGASAFSSCWHALGRCSLKGPHPGARGALTGPQRKPRQRPSSSPTRVCTAKSLGPFV